MIYFDNAATTGKKPLCVINAINYALKNLSANPGRSGHNLSQKAAFKIYNARKNIAEYFDATGPECVCFTSNCTSAINFVLKGILKTDDHVIISDLEHNAVLRPIHKMGINCDIANVSFIDDYETVESFKKLIKNNTKMIFCTAASNVTGKVLPLEKIGKLCKENGILFGVDAAQLAGILPISMKTYNIDYLCIAPHKGFYSPMGLGVLIAEKPIDTTIIEGGTGTNSLDYNQPDSYPEMLESGTLNLPAIIAADAGLNFVKSKAEIIYNHEIKLMQLLYNFLAKKNNIKLYTPYPTKNMYAPVLSFNVLGKTSEDISTILNKCNVAVRSGIHCAPLAHKKIGTTEIGTVRVSPSIFNTDSEIFSLINILKKIK